MGCARTAIGLLLSLAVLAGCNTTDALTPPVDVGGGRFPNSPPVTDRDLQHMADTQQPVYPRNQRMAAAQPSPVYDQPVESEPMAAPQQQDQGTNRLAKPGPGAPPTTLEQQAARAGGQQARSQPDAGQDASIPRQSTTAAPAAAPAGEQVASAEKNTIRFLPIIGAPLEAVTPLSRQLGTEARNRGYVIKGTADNSASHVLKGYFSAVAGGGSITVTYVWDILDNNGARLNRIQGQENFPGNASDPWTAVPPSVMQTIAAKTMDSYARWQAGP